MLTIWIKAVPVTDPDTPGTWYRRDINGLPPGGFRAEWTAWQRLCPAGLFPVAMSRFHPLLLLRHVRKRELAKGYGASPRTLVRALRG